MVWYNIFSRLAFSSTPFFSPSRKAKLLLKKKRYQEQLLDKTENQISNLERMVSGVGFLNCIWSLDFQDF